MDIEPVGSRKDNYRIRFEDGRERNVSEDKLKVVENGDNQMYEGVAKMGFDQENRCVCVCVCLRSQKASGYCILT